ncbi:virion morphogenesis family like protein [Pelagibacter phage HTVC111P]|nr:virion morphogenesis family like protein [Pelagibacter phage HTVC111P]
MAVTLKITSNQKQVSQKFKKFQSVLSRVVDKGVKQAGFQLVDIIRTKTQKGIDFRDRPFAPYSQGYLKKLNREGKSTNVDLFYTGRMLGALTPSGSVKKTGKHKVSVNFTNSQMRQRAVFNQVLGKTKREFFGFNNRTEKIISKQFNRFVEKELRKFRI